MTAAEILRTVIVVVVGASCAGWGVSTNRSWSRWADDLRAKLVSVVILPILALNGWSIAKAATLGRPVTWETFGYLLLFVLLNVVLWIPLPRDQSIPSRRKTDRKP